MEKWETLNYPSNMAVKKQNKCKSAFKILDNIDFIILEPDGRACYSRLEYMAVSEPILKAGLRLPIYLFSSSA